LDVCSTSEPIVSGIIQDVVAWRARLNEVLPLFLAKRFILTARIRHKPIKKLARRALVISVNNKLEIIPIK
jgi:hypothetical protein